MSKTPKNIPIHRRAHISYRSEDEKLWDARGITVAHEHIRRPKALARMRRIRHNAAILLAARGMYGISLADIARAAKVASTAITYYYSKRERLLHDVLIHHTDALLKIVETNFILHQNAADPAAWLFDLTRDLLSAVTHAERPGHRVLIYTLHTLPDIERDEITYRLRMVRHAITQPLSRLGDIEWGDDRLEPISYAYLAMLGQAAIWFPAAEFPDADAPAVEAHARLLTRMGIAGVETVRAGNASLSHTDEDTTLPEADTRKTPQGRARGIKAPPRAMPIR